MQTRALCVVVLIALTSIGYACAQPSHVYNCDEPDRRDYVNCLRVADEAKKLVPNPSDGSYHDIRFPTRPLTTANDVCKHYTPLQDQPHCDAMYPDTSDLKLSSFINSVTKFRVPEDECWFLLTQSRAKMTGREHILPKSECKAYTLSGKPRCVFFHGVGESGPKTLHANTPRGSMARSSHPGFLIAGDPHTLPANEYASIQNYWGSTATKIAGECEPYFFWTETATTPWDKQFLQDEYCGVLNVLYPAVIFTHSMGNLVISAGVINRRPGCLAIEKYGGWGTTRWFGIQGPLQGATPTGLSVYCKYKIVRKLAGARCAKDGEIGIPPSYGSMVLTYKSEEPNSLAQLKCPMESTLKQCIPLAYSATRLMSGSLCGLSPKASQSLSKFKLKKKVNSWLLSALARLTTKVTHSDDHDWIPSKMQFPKSGNDGMVGFSSCQLYTADGQRLPYFGDPVQPFYAFRGNHADGTCRFDDYDKDPAQQSCAWLINSVRYIKNEFEEIRQKKEAGPEESVYAKQHRMNKEREATKERLQAEAAAHKQQQQQVSAPPVQQPHASPAGSLSPADV